jgi:hypothetical protein
VKSIRSSDPPPPVVPGNPSAAAFAAGRYEIALVEATLSVPTADIRRAIDEAQRLADELGRLPGMQVEVAESPLDVRSTLQLQGKLDPAQPPTMEARFVLRLTRDRGARA